MKQHPSLLVRQRIPHADPRMHQLFDGWLAARDGSGVARRAAFDPMTISRMLEFVWIYRMSPGVGDYVCDLAGEEVNAVWGRSIKGRTLTEIVGVDHQTTLAARWDGVRCDPAILYSATASLPDPHFVHRVERMVLPMMAASGEIDAVLGVSLYDVRRHLVSAGVDSAATVPAAVVRIPVEDL